jgi:hypothetical protein
MQCISGKARLTDKPYIRLPVKIKPAFSGPVLFFIRRKFARYLAQRTVKLC